MFYTVDDFPFEVIQDFKILKRRRGNPATEKTDYRYLDVITAFDIETTNDKMLAKHEKCEYNSKGRLLKEG